MTVLELLEAEGRSLRDNAYRLGAALLLLALAGCAAIVAIGLIIAGLFLGLQPAVGSAWAAIITALFPLAIGGMLLWCATIIRQ